MSNKFYPTKTPITAVMIIKIGKSKIPTLITQNTENKISTLFANRIKNIWTMNISESVKKQLNILQSSQNMGFSDQPISNEKTIQKIRDFN